MSVKVLVYDNYNDEHELSELIEKGYKIVSHQIATEKKIDIDYYYTHYFTLVKKT